MNILITGATSGIGKATTVNLLQNNNNINVIGLGRNLEELKSLKNEFEEKFIPINIDLLNIKNIPLIINETLKQIKKIDHVVLNAGMLKKENFNTLDLEVMNELININFVSQIVLLKALIPYFDSKTQSHILNISSIGALPNTKKFSELSLYTSTKAAFMNYLESVQSELKNKNIIVNQLCLGSVNTKMFNEAFPNSEPGMQKEDIASFINHFLLNGYKVSENGIISLKNTTP